MVEAPFLRKLAICFAVIPRPVDSHNSLWYTMLGDLLCESLQTGWYIVPREYSLNYEYRNTYHVLGLLDYPYIVYLTIDNYNS